MRKQVLALSVLTTVLVASASASAGFAGSADPIITVDGLSTAAKLSAELRTTLAPKIKELNARFEKIVTVLAEQGKGSKQHNAEMHEAMKGIHEIMKQLDPDQRAAVHAYLLGQLKAAGIQMPRKGHGPDSHEHHEGMHDHPAPPA